MKSFEIKISDFTKEIEKIDKMAAAEKFKRINLTIDFEECTHIEKGFHVHFQKVHFPAGVTLDLTIKGEKLYAIDNEFMNGDNNLIKLTLPDSITSIGDHFLWGASLLEGIKLPEKTTDVGLYFLHFCTSLKTIIMPKCFENRLDYMKSYNKVHNIDNPTISYYGV